MEQDISWAQDKDKEAQQKRRKKRREKNDVRDASRAKPMAFITPVASNRFDVKRRKKKEDKNLARIALRNSKCLHVGIKQRRGEKGKRKIRREK